MGTLKKKIDLLKNRLQEEIKDDGYFRAKIPTSGANTYHVILFKQGTEIKKIQKDGHGEVYIFNRGDTRYAYFEKYNFAINAGKKKEKSIEQIEKAILAFRDTDVKYSSKHIEVAPNPFSQIIPPIVMAELKKLMRGRTRGRDNVCFFKEGRFYFGNYDYLYATKKEYLVPETKEISLADFKKTTELYFHRNGEISAGEEYFSDVKDTNEVFNYRSAFDTNNYQMGSLDITPAVANTIGAVDNVADTNNMKFELNGTLLLVENKEGTFVATNTRELTLSKKPIPTPNLADDGYIIIKGGLSERAKKIYFSEKYFLIDEGEVWQHAGRIHGRFPDYKRLMPEYPKHSIKVDAKALDNMLKKIDKKEENISIEFKEKSILISVGFSTSPIGEVPLLDGNVGIPFTSTFERKGLLRVLLDKKVGKLTLETDTDFHNDSRERTQEEINKVKEDTRRYSSIRLSLSPLIIKGENTISLIIPKEHPNTSLKISRENR